MRTLTLYMAALVSMLGIATAAQSAIMIDFETSGVIANSSTITVDIYLTATGTSRVAGYGFSVDYDTGLDSGTKIANAPTHAGAGSWTSGGPPVPCFDLGGTCAGVMGASTLSTPADDISAADGKVFIGALTFHINDAGNVLGTTGCINCGGPIGDGFVGTGDQTLVFNTLTVIPEPTTASLLCLGLLGLTVAGRRRN